MIKVCYRRNPDHNLCPVGKAVSRTFLTALRPWPKADAENQPSELGCERCAMLAEEPVLAGETMVIIQSDNSQRSPSQAPSNHIHENA